MSRPWLLIPEVERTAILDAARGLKADGFTWAAISRRLDMGYDNLRYRLDPAYHRRQQARWRAAHAKNRFDHNVPRPEPSPPKSDVAARRAEIPLDLRSITARLCGDPLPGRSALDQREAAA